jgi:hypothetical protein
MISSSTHKVKQEIQEEWLFLLMRTTTTTITATAALGDDKIY